MLKGTTVVDAGIYDDRVAGVMDDFDPADPIITTDWHRHDLEYDSAVGRVQEEIERRIRIMKNAYPFSIDGGQLKYLGSVRQSQSTDPTPSNPASKNKIVVLGGSQGIRSLPGVTVAESYVIPTLYMRLTVGRFVKPECLG